MGDDDHSIGCIFPLNGVQRGVMCISRELGGKTHSLYILQLLLVGYCCADALTSPPYCFGCMLMKLAGSLPGQVTVGPQYRIRFGAATCLSWAQGVEYMVRGWGQETGKDHRYVGVSFYRL